MKKKILLTGCAGFIGANFVNRICTKDEVKDKYSFHIIDLLTYAGDYSHIENSIETHDHLSFEKMDIRDKEGVNNLFEKENYFGCINFAAESHVDNSIKNPNVFVETNVLGTLNLLNASLKTFEKNGDFKFLQIGTDEVYGSLTENDPAFNEDNQIKPNSPYSASKAAADHLVQAYNETFKLPTLITRCSNNYGPLQNQEKLIPLMIHNAIRDIPLPVYGDGRNIRDWIHVFDHNLGVWDVFTKGKIGEVYNLGGDQEMRNIDIVKLILSHLGKSEDLIKFVEDRKGHDWRYAMDFSKAKSDLGWQPNYNFKDGLAETIEYFKEKFS